MSEDMEWSEPPSSSYANQRNSAQDFIRKLRERPGEWAKYPRVMSNSSAGTTYKTKYPGTEWTVRKRPDRQYDMWGRWVGETS